MTVTFSPPSVNDGAAYRADADIVTRKLWGHMARHNTGVSILKTNGVYVEQQYVYHDDIVAADIFYQGGHIYEVSDEEAFDLIAAGYEVDGVPVEPEPEPTVGGSILTETGDSLLLESGDLLLMEDDVVTPAGGSVLTEAGDALLLESGDLLLMES